MTTLQHVRQDFYALRHSIVRQDIQHIHFDKEETRIYASDKEKIYIPNASGKLFHADNTFVQLIMGPYGSGKSTICVNKIVRHACSMPRWKNGRRRAKWLIIRNTSGELQSTTLQTWLAWFGDLGDIKKRQKPLLTYEHTFNDGNGLIELELVFIALDRDEDIRKLKSIEATCAYINELSEVPQAVLHHLIGRVNHRYPSKSFCSENYWSGIIADTNPPDEDHWIHKDFEENPTDNYRIFHQPSGLIQNVDGSFSRDKKGNYIANEDCDNYTNLSPDYYVKLAEKRSEGFIKVYCGGKYGIVESGKRVYPEYNDDLHSVPKLDAIQGLPIHLCWDFGLTPACIVFQVSPRGQARVLKEYLAQDMGIRTFAKNVVLPSLPVDFVYNRIGESEADPAGLAGDSIMEELSCIGELNDLGIRTNPSSTNDPDVRISSVRYFLNSMIDGQPALLISREGCPTLRKGFINGYVFKRLSVTGDERYQDKPNKNRFSHCFVGNTLVYTPSGNRPIKDLNVNDVVTTPFGDRKIVATMNSNSHQLIELFFSNNEKIICTHDHPFITVNGVVHADKLHHNDVLLGIDSKEVKIWAEKENMKSKNLMRSNIIKKEMVIGKLVLKLIKLPAIFIEMFGNFIMEPFRPTTISIISTKTRETMTYQTLNALLNRNTYQIMEEKEWLKDPWKVKNTWNRLDLKHLNGISQMKEGNGTLNMGKKLGLVEKIKYMSALDVRNILKGSLEQIKKVFVLLIVKLNIEESQESITKKESVLYAKKNLSTIDTKKNNHVLHLVGIKQLAIEERVYDLTVEDAHCFFANSILVSNCHDALQYGLMKFASERIIDGKKKEENKVDMWNPVMRWQN